MEDLDRQASQRQALAFALLGVVTLGWMAGLVFGFAHAGGASGSLVRTTPDWLAPALQGVIGLAVASVAVVLTSITVRIRIRAHVLSEALPRLLDN